MIKGFRLCPPVLPLLHFMSLQMERFRILIKFQDFVSNFVTKFLDVSLGNNLSSLVLEKQVSVFCYGSCLPFVTEKKYRITHFVDQKIFFLGSNRTKTFFNFLLDFVMALLYNIVFTSNSTVLTVSKFFCIVVGNFLQLSLSSFCSVLWYF